MDVGNTHIVVGAFEDGVASGHWRISTDVHRTEDEYGVALLSMLRNAGISGTRMEGAVLASVVPPLTPVMEKTLQSYLGVTPLVVGPGIKTGVNVKCENPKDVGADRIAHAVGAFHKYGGPAIVVDFDTATIFDVISRTGDYIGGAIAPGVLTALNGLQAKAARLPKIELSRPGSVIGRTTVESMRSGFMYGFADLADGLVTRLASELKEEPRVIGTGWLAHLMAPLCRTIDVVEPFLALYGLYLIYLKNS